MLGTLCRTGATVAALGHGRLRSAIYQTRHTFAAGFTMGWPGLQEKASANSGMFTTTPLMR